MGKCKGKGGEEIKDKNGDTSRGFNNILECRLL